MSSATRAAEDLIKLGKMLKGIIDFSGELENTGSLERYNQELSSRADSLKKQDADLQAAIEQAKAVLAATQADYEDIKGKAQEMVDRALGEAKSAKQSLLDEAKTKAEGIVSSAQSKADKIVSDMGSAKEQLGELDKQVEERRAMLATLNAHIEEIRNKVA